MDSCEGIDPITKALHEVSKIQKPEQSAPDLVDVYEKWSTYDENVAALTYKGPTVVGDALTKYLSHTKDVRILDVAAGTGLIGEEVKARGFANIDALDPSRRMLDDARQKIVYTNFIQDFFPCEKASIETSSYDVFVSSGGFSEGHMKCDSLPEMVRCVKRGGIIVIAFAEKHLIMVEEYKDRLVPLMKQLETEGQWKMLERTVVPNFYHTNTGLLFVYKVTKADN